MTELLREASTRLEAWIEREGYVGWDPYDALNSPILRRLTFRNRHLGQAWVQLFKCSPVNLRPLFGVPKGHNPKAMGLFLASHCRKYLLTKDQTYLQRALGHSSWLQANTAGGYAGSSWGYNFDWPNRGAYVRAGTPTIVNTAFIGLAFLDLVASIEENDTSDHPVAGCLETARSACDFILRHLNTTHPGPDDLCFSYTPFDTRYVHNANVLGAWLLAEVAARTGEPVLAKVARHAARFTCRRQRPSGAWWYGEGANDRWVDNFHTGFVLVGLRRIGRLLETHEFESVVQKGFNYWARYFFRDDGAPKYYPHRSYPIDIHALAQSILTYLEFKDLLSGAVDRATSLARWAIANMMDPSGFFYYQIRPSYTVKIPYMRWAQAWMLRAFVELQWAARSEDMD